MTLKQVGRRVCALAARSRRPATTRAPVTAAAQADGPAWARFRHAGDQTAPVRWPVISQGGQTRSSRPVPATPVISVIRRSRISDDSAVQNRQPDGPNGGADRVTIIGHAVRRHCAQDTGSCSPQQPLSQPRPNAGATRITRVLSGMERLICRARSLIPRRGVLTLRWSFAAEAAGLGLAREVSL